MIQTTLSQPDIPTDRPLSPDFVASLATFPGLPPGWWADDAFTLQAAALGHHGPAQALPAPRVDVLAEQRTWERVAAEILSRDFLVEPADRSTIEAWEIGLRAFPGSTLCTSARGKLSVIEPARWRKEDLRANRLLPR